MPNQPISCPICRHAATTRLLEEFTLTAETKGTVREVNAVGAFVCKEKGHIFFVRFADIEWAEAATETA